MHENPRYTKRLIYYKVMCCIMWKEKNIQEKIRVEVIYVRNVYK
jgi:hypothetical protein